MVRQRSILRPFWKFCAIGLTVSVAMAAFYAGGGMRTFEAWMLDWRFQHANHELRQSDEIRLIAIDDQSVTQVGRWPWPRKYMADMVDVLHEVGAARIALDLHFPEAQRILDLDASQTTLGADGSTHSLPVDYDTMFAQAIRRANNVYLPVVFDAISGDIDIHSPMDKALNLVRGRFWLSDDQVAEELQVPVEQVSRSIGPVRRHVALEIAERSFADDANVTAESVAAQVFSGPGSPGSGNAEEIPWALAQVRARAIVRRSLIDWPGSVPSQCKRELMQAADPYEVQVAIEPLAAGAAGFGHVIVPPEKDSVRQFGEGDGVIRRLPLLLRWEGKLVPQMALRLAGDMLGYDWQHMRIEPGRVVIPTKSGREARLPLDETGQTLVNWYLPPDTKWQSCFEGAVPAGIVLEIAQLRRWIRENESWWRTRLLRMVQMIQPTELRRYEQILDQQEQIEQQLQRRHKAATQPEPRDYRNLQDQLQELRTGEARIRTACIEILKEEGPGLAAAIERETDPRQKEQLKEYQSLYKDVALGQLRSHIDQVNGRLSQRIDARKQELATQLGGKTCLVGCTATALADMASTPVWTTAPGVMTHAQLLNSLLQDRLIWPVSTGVNTAIVLLCCVVMGVITAAQGPRTSLGSMAVACSVYFVVVSYGLFQYLSLEVALATPVIGMFVTWAMITSYRELVEERAKRRFARTLQQYTSPAIARQMAENPELVTKAETREVTCFFSDLKGFTSISERIGAEATQQILNVYLDRMTEVLDRHEALINKFLGDGIFAFFNPAIHPQPDHARRACIASLEAMEALEQLKREAGAESYRALQMRIGLASGPAVVGNCGSERKFDYTCIGDTVNLASRLEGANKAFGTGVLINGKCKKLVGDGFQLRYLGRVLVVGRAMYEDTYELVGHSGTVDAKVREDIECFEGAVRCFLAGNLGSAKSGFEECCRRQRDDMAARYYLGLCEGYVKDGLPEKWNGAVELGGK